MTNQACRLPGKITGQNHQGLPSRYAPDPSAACRVTCPHRHHLIINPSACRDEHIGPETALASTALGNGRALVRWACDGPAPRTMFHGMFGPAMASERLASSGLSVCQDSSTSTRPGKGLALGVGFCKMKSFWDSSADSLDRAMAVLGLLCAFAGRYGRFRVHWSRGGPGGDGGTRRSVPLCRLAGQKTVSVAPKRPKIALKRDHFGRPFRTEPAAPRTANARFPSPNDVNRWDQSSVPLFEAA
jgi:hypothetical protein